MIVLKNRKRKELTVVQLLGNKEMGPKKNNVNKNNASFWLPVKKNKIHVAPKFKPGKATTTFQECLRSTLIIGQVFSMIPVFGIMSDNPADVKFIVLSWKCIYSLISFIGQSFLTFMCVYKMIYSNTSLNSTAPVIFYGTTFFTMLMFFRVGRSWPNLVKHICRTEELDPNFDNRLTKRCNITCVIVLTLALLEHILSLLSALAGAMVCYPNEHLYEGFVRHFYPWVFNVIPFSVGMGILTQKGQSACKAKLIQEMEMSTYVNIFFICETIGLKKANFYDVEEISKFIHVQSTFIWNFSDLFVIIMSYYLTSRLEQINKKLIAVQGKYLPEVFWRTSREDYCRATQLVRKVDEVISGIIFISFANNLFYICLQLFNTLEDGIKGTGECSSRARGITQKTPLLGGYEAAVYFVFSLVFLISRSVAVSLIASQVHAASLVPAPVLYDVPSPVYCVEVQRFLDQVNGDKVALSGLQFFSVTRGLLLTVAGTIVTYELVMVQFNSPNSPDPSANSTHVASLNSTTVAP